MRTFYNYLLVGAVATVPAVFVASAQTAAKSAAAGSAATSPNNWQKEYADGMAAYNAGNYREAETQLKAALKSSRDFASNDPKLLNTLRDLAQAYRAQSKYAEAEPLMERHLALKERFLGKFHPDLAKELDQLGRVCFAQMKFVSAEAYFRRELVIMEKKFGPEFLDLIPALTNVAQSCQALNKFSDAEPLLKRAISIREKNQGARSRRYGGRACEACGTLCCPAEMVGSGTNVPKVDRNP